MLVGERTNVIGSRKFKDLIVEDKFEEGSEVGRAQVKGGAQVLDVCLANPDRDETADMDRFMEQVTRKVKVPLMIDSTDAVVIERGLRAPSEQVLDAIAKTLRISADALYEQAGVSPPGSEPEDNAVLDAMAEFRSMHYGWAQEYINRWTDDLLKRVLEHQIDPSFVITHTEPLERGPEMYKTFRDKQDGCIKVVLKPGANGALHA